MFVFAEFARVLSFFSRVANGEVMFVYSNLCRIPDSEINGSRS